MAQNNDEQAPVPNMAAQWLRDAIDKGLTGDKVPAADPAASPLGTDDEAAGTRPSMDVAPEGAVPKTQRIPEGQEKGDDAYMKGDYGVRKNVTD
ncbi:hypothetical protein [Azospirillum sp. SYSU D00513]|uniref:hypothetical protein n=1 Tax=Azospirillum sp. SYSU D00513 TaxID=2812561 RepID=UPI001A974926|nr:hypothetical protein [Azospirillum sp. SYSU D00513]